MPLSPAPIAASLLSESSSTLLIAAVRRREITAIAEHQRVVGFEIEVIGQTQFVAQILGVRQFQIVGAAGALRTAARRLDVAAFVVIRQTQVAGELPCPPSPCRSPCWKIPRSSSGSRVGTDENGRVVQVVVGIRLGIDVQQVVEVVAAQGRGIADTRRRRPSTPRAADNLLTRRATSSGLNFQLAPSL